MERRIDKKFFTNSLSKEATYTDKEKSLLLVVDIQPKLMDTMEKGERTIRNTVGLITVSYTHLTLPTILLV